MTEHQAAAHGDTRGGWPRLNVPLARKVMEHIVTNPREWEQGTWYATGSDAVDAITGRLVVEYLKGRSNEVLDDGIVDRLRREAEDVAPECGTAACFAGHAVLMSGYRIDGVIVDDGAAPGYRRTVRQVATELLGLTDRQAERLFHTDNTIQELWSHLELLSGGEIRPPEVA